MLDTIVKKGLTVAQSEKMIQKESEPKENRKKKSAEGTDPQHPHRPEHHRAGGGMIEKSGIDIISETKETEDEVVVTLHFPK